MKNFPKAVVMVALVGIVAVAIGVLTTGCTKRGEDGPAKAVRTA